MNSFNTQLHSDENNYPTQDELALLMQMAEEQEMAEVNAELAAISDAEAEERLEAEADLLEQQIEEFEAEYEPTDEDWADYEEYVAEYDGQPSEYDEWQDYMGGDDWDHGQYDEF
jgi:hypothetical protein